MKNPKLFYLVILFIIGCVSSVYSQSNNIEINYSRPPLNMLKADDMWNFTLKNNSTQDLEFTLYGTLAESKAGLIATGQTMAISLRKGETKKFKISDLSKTPDITYVHSDGRYKEALMRAGNLPDGEYTICVYAKQTGTNEEIGNDCIEQEITIEKDANITLLTPDNNENISSADPVIFSWSVIGAKTEGPFKIKIVEILGDESPENAMLKNKAFFEKEDIRTTTFQYPSSAPKFKEGKKYAWKVSKNNIESSVMLFSVSNPGIQASLNKFECTSNPGEYYFEIKLELTSTSTYHSVTVPQNPIVVISSNPTATISINYITNPQQTLTIPFSPTIAITGNFVTTSAIALSQIQFVTNLYLNISSVSIQNSHFLEMSNIPSCQTICDCTTPQKWVFGDGAILEFNGNNPPTVNTITSTNHINTKEGTAVATDNNGNILFYTDGRTIWNKNNVPMLNGTGLNDGNQFHGGSSSGQSALIVPWPDSCHKYFVFTTGDLENSGASGYRYSVVNMSLDNNNGAIEVTNPNTTKDVSLFIPSTEKLAGIRNPSTGNYWVVTHESGNNNFKVYEITSAGLNTNPSVFSVGTLHPAHINSMAGQMKFSPDGKMLALAVGGNSQLGRFIEIFDFDIQTGQISNLHTLNIASYFPNVSYPDPFGLEFSANSEYLFYTLIGISNVPNQLYRLNLSNLSSQGQGNLIHSESGFQTLLALQRGPDNRIYVSRGSYDPSGTAIQFPTNHIGVINQPDDPIDVAYNDYGVVTTSNIFKQGFPNIVICSPDTTDIISSQTCEGNLMTNGDFSLGNPGSGSHPDVPGWFELFVYPNGRYNFIPVPPNNAIFTTEPEYSFCVPTPTSGNYAGFWVHRSYNGLNYYEGLFNQLANPISPNSGDYELSFDLASLLTEGNGTSQARLAVYGIYNPSNILGVPPTHGNEAATNLFPGMVELGEVNVPPNNPTCQKIRETITFSTNTNFLTNGITHILITRSDNMLSNALEYVAVDNFCLVEVENTTTNECYPPPSGMVGWWPGDGNANDITSFSNHGTFINSPSFTANGKVSQAFEFNGTDQYIKIPDDNDLDVTGNLTIDAWVNIESFKNQNSIIVWKGGTPQNITSSYSLFLNYESKKFGFMITNGTAYEFITSTTIAQLNTWYHVTGVADNNNLKIYINGIDEGQVSRTISPASNNYPVFIGAIENYSNQAVSNFFHGIIDEVELFNRALTLEEIQGIYDAGVLGKCKDITITEPCNCNVRSRWNDIGNNIGYTKNGNAFASSNFCNGIYNIDANSDVTLSPDYLCFSENCTPRYKYRVGNGGISAFVPSPYTLHIGVFETNITVFAYCGDQICDSCTVTLVPPPMECSLIVPDTVCVDAQGNVRVDNIIANFPGTGGYNWQLISDPLTVPNCPGTSGIIFTLPGSIILNGLNIVAPCRYKLTVTRGECTAEAYFNVKSCITECNCGEWSSNEIKAVTPDGSGNILCGSNLANAGPGSGINLYFPDFNCLPSSCTPTYTWNISGPISNSGTTNQILNADFSIGGNYEIKMYAYCDGKLCDSCWFTTQVVTDDCCNLTIESFPSYTSICKDSEVRIKWDGCTASKLVNIKLINNCNDIEYLVAANQSMSGSMTWTLPKEIECDSTCKWMFIVEDIDKKCKDVGPSFIVKCCDDTSNCKCGEWKSKEVTVKFNPGDGGYFKCGDFIQRTEPAYGVYFDFPDYYCPDEKECKVSYQWSITGLAPIQNGSGNIINSADFPEEGSYTVTMYAYCGDKLCDSCVININISKHKCECTKWNEKINIRYLEKDSKNDLSIICGSKNINGPVPAGDIEWDGKFYCTGDNCNAEYLWTLYDGGTPVSQGSAISVPFNINLPSPGTTYRLIVTGKCGKNICDSCVVYIRTSDEEKGCKCSRDKYLHLVTIGEKDTAKFRCGETKLIKNGKTIRLTPANICNPADCLGFWKMDIYDLQMNTLINTVTGMGAGSYYDLTVSTPTGYRIMFTGVCGTDSCKCEFWIRTDPKETGCDCGNGPIWYFGYGRGLSEPGVPGLNFTNNTVTSISIPLTNYTFSSEGSAVMSDNLGNVKFYTNGINVWDATNINMINGSLFGDISSTHAALITPWPGENNKYYIFTGNGIDKFNTNKWGSHYSIVDMTLPGWLGQPNLGQVTIANQRLRTNSGEELNSTEQLAAVQRPDCGYWLVLHGYNLIGDTKNHGGTFYVYNITNNGLQTIPDEYTVGRVNAEDPGILKRHTMGASMKISQDGSKIAVSYILAGYIEVFNFNLSTGQITGPTLTLDNIYSRQVPSNSGPYGLEFSPDGRYLYFTVQGGFPNHLIQVDLNTLTGFNQFSWSPLPNGIRELFSTNYPPGNNSNQHLGQLQLGPDDKIYVARKNTDKLGTIDNPNSATSMYNDGSIQLLNKNDLGLPTTIICPKYNK